MKIQTLKELEKSIGGRPRSKRKKVRLSIYLDKTDYMFIKKYSNREDMPISVIVRNLIKTLIKE